MTINGGGEVDLVTFLLKVGMHCRCEGCTKKIKKGFESITSFPGVLRVEPNRKSGELKVVGKVKPEELRVWLHKKLDKKSVKLITYAPSAPPIHLMDSYEYRRPNREGYN